MSDPAATSSEEWIQARAKALLGPGVRLTRRVVTTHAGPRTGVLVVGYRIVRRIPAKEGRPATEQVWGVSPSPGSPLDLSCPPSPEAALDDAIRRRAEGHGPYEDEVPGRDLPAGGGPGATSGSSAAPAARPESELTTSTLDLDA